MNGSPKIRPEAERVAMDVLEGDTTNGRLHRALIAFCEAEGLKMEHSVVRENDPLTRKVTNLESAMAMTFTRDTGWHREQRFVGRWREVEEER